MSIASHNESVSPAAIGDYAAGPAEYFALLKPRVMSLVDLDGAGRPAGRADACPSRHRVASLLAIAVGAGAAGALNMWWDADIDALMARTRPAPDSRRVGRAARSTVLRPDACRSSLC